MDEKFVICPFNKQHVIPRLRIQYHLVKCKKNHPFSNKIVCPYDATEYIDPINYTAHLSQCKRKRHLDVTEEFRNKQFESMQHGNISSQTFFVPGVEVTDEWDVKSDGQDDEENLTRDELKAMELLDSMSRAVQNACKYTPVVTQRIGRGKAIDHYQYYMDTVEKTPGNSSISQTVTYFPDLVHDEDVEIYKDAEDDSEIMNACEPETPKPPIVCDKVTPKNSINNVSTTSNTFEDDEIYEDAEKESINDQSKSTHLSLEKKPVDCQNNNSQSASNVLNNYHCFLGRGVNKNASSNGMGRGAVLRNAARLRVLKTEETPEFKTLDSIIANALRSSEQSTSKYDKNSTSPSEMDNEIASYNSANATSNKKRTPEDSTRFNASNNSPTKSPTFPDELDDEMICFAPRIKTRNTLDSILINVVKDLASTSLDNRERMKSEELRTSDEGTKDRLTPGFGRGAIWKDL